MVWSVTQWPLDQKLFVFISHLDGVLSLMVYPEHYWSAPKATPSCTYTHPQTPKTTYFVAENVTTKFCLMFIIPNIRWLAYFESISNVLFCRRYYFSLFLELSDISMPFIRALFDKISNAISFFLVCLIGRSLGLIYTGIRQSLRWKWYVI